MGTKLVGDHLSMGTELDGDRLSRGTESGGPEVRGSNGFGTKCVAAPKNGGYHMSSNVPATL